MDHIHDAMEDDYADDGNHAQTTGELHRMMIRMHFPEIDIK